MNIRVCSLLTIMTGGASLGWCGTEFVRTLFYDGEWTFLAGIGGCLVGLINLRVGVYLSRYRKSREKEEDNP
jgi:hypothetical protein